MNKLNEFDELVTNGVNDADGWFDYFNEVAVSKAIEFTNAEWKQLSELWKKKEEVWQIRLADLLGSFNPQESVSILEDMVKSGSQKVASEALNSLERMDGEGDEHLYVPDQEIIQLSEKIYSGEKNIIRKDHIKALQARVK